MFRTILRREFLDQILSPKFLIIALLCLVLVPASFLLNYSNYRDALREYDAGRREAKDSTTVHREPSALSAFGIGLESILAKTAVFSKYEVEVRGSQAQNEILGNINGKVDFVIIAGFLLGLFAVLYSGTMVCGEKEAGTLKLVLSYPVSRSAIIAAKLLGGISVLMIPLAVSYLLGLVLLVLEGFPLFEAENAARVGALLGISVLYLAAMFSLGLLISARTQRSSIALLAGFFVWISLTFVIPKTSEPIAGLLHPVQTEETARTNRAQVRSQIEKEKGRAMWPLMSRFLKEEAHSDADWAAYVKAREPIAKGFEDRLDQALKEFDAQFEREKSVRRSLALNIARLSPASVFTQAALDFCHTGVIDLDNFSRSLQSHYAQLYQAAFRFQFSDTFESEDGHSSQGLGGSAPDLKIEYPSFRYQFLSLEETFRATATDILLLVFFNMVFFAAAYFSFTRYDVR